MAYVNQTSSLQREPILIAIAALHVGVIYALATGLQNVVFPPEDKSVVGEQIPLPKVDHPKTVEPDEAIPAPRPAPSSAIIAIVPPRAGPVEGVELAPIPGASDLGPVMPLPMPRPSVAAEPSLTPKAARPLGSPGLWVTPEDYPARGLRGRLEGVSRFRLTIGADGAIRDCTIVSSSGHAELDQATCSNLAKRGRFDAATDSGGKSVTGSYSGAVRWKLPRD